MPRLRFALLTAAIISTVLAQGENRQLTITAKEAVKLYIDGVLRDIPNGRNMSLTDTVPVNATARILAFQGINLMTGCPGIVASITDDYLLSNSSWKCFDISGGEEWTNIGFDDSGWPSATELRQNIDTTGDKCPNLPYVPSISSNAFWIWMDDELMDIIYCRAYLPVCASSPCLNGATCNINEVDQCTCVAGFTGYYCETEIDECASGPCMNGGTCQDFLNAFECSCAAGYTGTRCETDVLECASEPCLNNGTCEDYINGYRCICPANYTGYDCETEVDACSSFPCQNNGTCEADSDGSYTCTCPIGFTGSNCETEVSECASQPCLNGGTCQDLINGFQCICDDGYTGIFCESSEVDACSSFPCQNNGTCEADSDGNYTCTCPIGFTGSNCETEFDACSSFPCQNNGTCEADSDGNYTCTCPTGFTGSNCETEVSECASQPCLNGGTCQDLINGFQCICTDKYTGIYCESSVSSSPMLLITADRNLISLFVDNVSYPLNIISSNNWTLPDHIAIPASARLIALRAGNSFAANCSGILGSVGEDFVTDAKWKCSTDNAAGWFRTDFNDSHWPQAIEYGSNIPPFICSYRAQIPEISAAARWIWTDNMGVAINCRGYLPSPCDSDPCQNGGTCIEDSNGGYNCSCDPQFTGVNCESVIPCASDPCQNGGTCIEDSNGGYNCSCDPLFTGINCESDLYMELVLTADRAISALYVDGIYHPLNITTSNSWYQTEGVVIYSTTTLIAIRATEAFQAPCSGILSSIGNYSTTDVNWKCSTDNPPGWFNVGFNDSAWPYAIDYGSNSPPFQCPYRYELPQISSNAHWIFTTNQLAPANCRGYLP